MATSTAPGKMRGGHAAVGPHLGEARAQGSREAHRSEMGHRRGTGAEEGTGSSGEEVVVVVSLFGTVDPLELGKRVLTGGGHLGLMPAQLNEEQGELLGLSGITGH